MPSITNTALIGALCGLFGFVSAERGNVIIPLTDVAKERISNGETNVVEIEKDARISIEAFLDAAHRETYRRCSIARRYGKAATNINSDYLTDLNCSAILEDSKDQPTIDFNDKPSLPNTEDAPMIPTFI